MLYFFAVPFVLGLVLGAIPSRKERVRRRAVREAYDNFYLREEARCRAVSSLVASPD